MANRLPACGVPSPKAAKPKCRVRISRSTSLSRPVVPWDPPERVDELWASRFCWLLAHTQNCSRSDADATARKDAKSQLTQRHSGVPAAGSKTRHFGLDQL